MYERSEYTRSRILNSEAVGKIVTRLRSVVAIGIARAFATGAHFSEVIHDPRFSPQEYSSPKEYVIAKGKGGQTVINHFYEKLLLLKNRMNTRTAKNLADGRHRFMEEYLKRFFWEWDGKV
ncbi:MAG: hypothetical protein HYU35_01390 [Parcubacteria group bacterium]|nr:hypothetical protein [Parcubacteria group bacterium]